MNSITLSDLIDEYLASLRTGGYAKNTIRNHVRTARLFLSFVGNIQVRHVQPRHVDDYFARRLSAGIATSSLNIELVTLRALFKFAYSRRYVVATADPTAHRRRMRVSPTSRTRLPATDFARLLDATTHPRDRIVVALALYLLLRQSEIRALTIADVDLTHGVISARIIKTDKYDDMPIASELDTELRRWLTWYAQKAGPLQSSWFLAPAKGQPVTAHGKIDVNAAELRPTRAVLQPERVIQRALVAIGLDLRDTDGKTKREGVHTLRRSAARAVFDRLVEDGYDGAGRIVQSLLHHSHFKQTEIYLGIELDQKRRDDMIRGKEMFPVNKENVVELEMVRGEDEGNRFAL